jgi:hypothetical protein
MLKRALFTVGIAAVILPGAHPGTDACGLDASLAHACCAEHEPKPTTSCCSSTEAPARQPGADHGMDCTCDHPPSTPGAIPATGAAPDLNHQDLTIAAAGARPGDGTSTLSVASSCDGLRSHPPPPAYLLNCADLN